MAVCIECGLESKQQLFRQYTGGSIQLLQCENCGKVIDKYVEFDVVILLLDVLLLRIQSYRHLLFNYHLTSSLLWKLSLVLVLCESYTRLRRLGLKSSDAVVLQVNFHSFFVLSIADFAVLYVTCYGIMWIFSSPTFKHVLRMLVISTYGKLSALAAMIWTGDFYLWLPLVLVLPSQFMTLRAAVRDMSVVRAGVMVLILNVVPHATSLLLDVPRTTFVHHVIGRSFTSEDSKLYVCVHLQWSLSTRDRSQHHNIDEDIIQFKSLHCHFYPKTQWCVDKKEQVIEDKKRRALQQEPETPWTCECMWKKIICCQVYKDNYHKYMVNKMLEYKDNKDSVSNRDSASNNRDSASNNRDSASNNRDSASNSVGNKDSVSERLDRVKGKQAEAKRDYV